MPLNAKPYTSIFKSLKWMLVILSLFAAGDFLLRHTLILPAFHELEHQQAENQIQSIQEAIQRESYHLSNLAGDWAAWNDMYEFVLNGNQDFIDSNFEWESLNSSGIDLIYVYDLDGSLVYGASHEAGIEKNIILAEFPEAPMPRDNFFLQSAQRLSPVHGLIKTSHGPMFITASPILTSANEGPSRGTLIMGRFLNQQTIDSLSSQMHLPLHVFDPVSPEFEDLVAAIRLEKHVIRDSNDQFLQAYTLIHDPQGAPALLVGAQIPRDIWQQGVSTAKLSSIAILAVLALLALFTMIWILHFRHVRNQQQHITEDLVHKRTAQLAESETRLRTLIRTAPDLICLKDDTGHWLEANHALLKLFLLDKIDYRGLSDMQLAMRVPDSLVQTFKSFIDSDKECWHDSHALRQELKIAEISGKTRILDVSKAPVFYADGRRMGLVVVARDITDSVNMQTSLQKARKLETIGLMAGGVAHDLNNILSGIVGYPEMLLLELPDDSDLRSPLMTIMDSGQRAAAVVSDLLTVARGVAAPRTIANLNNIIEDYLNSPEVAVVRQHHPEWTVEKEFDEALLNIKGSTTHLRKCLMNLIQNAAEATGQNGLIRITTANIHLDTPMSEPPHLDSGDYVLLAISDNGHGIPEKDLAQIFEPFYSTKVMGRSGSGLGLTVIWNTVQDHGGGVRVRSGSQGTTFELYFPACHERIPETLDHVEIDHLKGDGQSILIVDDEPSQREIASRMLGMLGYRVRSAASGEEALEMLALESVDLMVIDMIMPPGMGGFETYRRALEIHPGMRAVIASGFAEDGDVLATQSLGASQFIRKPYLIRQIGIAVKKALADPICT